MAAIDKRPSGQWRARWREYPGGPQRSQTFARKADAQRFLTSLEHDKLTGAYVDPSKGLVPFAQFAGDWFARHGGRASTRERLAQELKLDLVPEFGAMPLAAIRPSHIEDWLRASTYSATTKRVRAATLSAIFETAIRDGYLVRNPTRGVKRPERDTSPIAPLSVDEVHALAANAPDHLRAAIVLGFGAGLRIGEVRGLTVDKFDALRRTIKVEQQLFTPQTGASYLARPKTPAAYRTVPLTVPIVDELAAHLARFGVGAVLEQPDKRGPRGGLIFHYGNGRPIPLSSFARTFRVVAGRVGVAEGTTFHDLRHHYASVLIAQGCSVKVVQARLGHARAAETLDTYSHLWPEDEERTRSAVDAAHGSAEAWRPARLSPG